MESVANRRRSVRPGDERITMCLLFGMALFSYFSIAIMQILLALAGLNWFIGLRRPDRPKVRAPLAPLMVGFLLVSLISATTARDLEGVRMSLSDGMPMLVFWMALNVLSTPARMRWACGAVVLGGTLAAMLGLIQAGIAGTGSRIAGSMSHYMTFSGVLMMACCVALAIVTFGSPGRRRLLQFLALLTILTALLMTETRGAWVGISAGALVVLGFRKLRYLPLIPIAAVLLYLAAPGQVQDRIRSTIDPTDRTANQRLIMWGVGMDIVADHPIIGVGPRRTSVYYDLYRPEDDPFRDEPIPGHLHNNVVEIAATRGLTGLFFWLAIWIVWYVKSVRAFADPDGEVPDGEVPADEDPSMRAAVVASLSALTAFQVMGMFEYNAGDSETNTLALFIMAFPMAVIGSRRLDASRLSG